MWRATAAIVVGCHKYMNVWEIPVLPNFHISKRPEGFETPPKNVCMILCVWLSYLIGAGSLIDSACVFIVLLSLGLVRHAVGLVYGCHVVHQGDGLHSLMDSAADGLADLGGCRGPGGRKVMGGLKMITEGTVIKRRAFRKLKRVLTFYNRSTLSWSRFFSEAAAIVASRTNNV